MAPHPMTVDDLRTVLSSVARVTATADTGWLLVGPPIATDELNNEETP